MKLKFVHFTIDDKFIDDSVKCFETANLTENVFYCLKKISCSFEYIKSSKVKQIRIEEAESIIDNLSNFDIVILHSLYAIPADLICKIPSKTKVVWYAWGFDLYGNPYPIKPLIQIPRSKLMPRTSRIFNSGYLTLKRLKSMLKHHLIRDQYSSSSAQKMHEAIQRINYFSGVFPVEHEMLISQCPDYRGKIITHNYIHPEEFNASDINEKATSLGNNIILGNSASFYCNHIDLLYALYNQTHKRDMKIYCPLSYAGRSFYIKKVIKKGKELFGDNFIPLLDYMPFDEYSKIIQSCNCMILGYYYQAATCNCLTSIWNGVKLFLPKDSMNYIEYKDVEGLEVYSIEDDLNDHNLENVVINDVKKQRVKISERYSFERWKADLQASICTIQKDCEGNA